MSAILMMLVIIGVIVLIAYVGFWLIDQMGVPHPANLVLKLIVGGLALYALLMKTGLLNSLG